ncbi:single-stranded nucleic acid binding R3H domain protein [Solidesulfovibrio fructosivorans JJ]]|uniref:RNA-binding protein KhpB n=1 Tax=Solidesulfovibrio fructosivorans JJ] TaxID=596151 RepID=E1JWU0_SOLFR|nr:RNA-binding cell elongation regulator Jag/EloR [Solidesulfovibrio fructosivorans]EFL51144.1 single-stranded nucleic acid binding R3H domain protein [Solidesulfovibrio fructosivorans JJ]]
MSEFRTFSGKTVDEAMQEACRHFGEPREKLEVEILSGGSSGIFGLVGKKKAEVRARLREEVNLLQGMEDSRKRDGAPKSERNSRSRKPPRQPAPEKQKPEPVAAEPVAPRQEAAPAPVAEPVAPPVAEPDPVDDLPDDAMMEMDEECATESPRRESRGNREERRPAAPETPPQPITPELEAIVREVMDQMLDGILGQIPEYEISGHSERVSVLILDEENSGLLIGREGQTLSSIQYLVNRIVIRRHGSPIKVQINTGEYRERQDDNLRKMAIFLADKAKTLGRPQSTKPLSSYHRRVVHLALQEDEAISTRSKGDGPLKRVLIVPRGRGNDAQPQQQGDQQRS